MSCHFCTFKHDKSIYKARFYVEWNNLLRGMEADCSECVFLIRCVELATSDTENITEVIYQPGRHYQVYYVGHSTNGCNSREILNPGDYSQEKNPLHIRKIANHLRGSTSSEATIKTIKNWLDECDSSHEACHQADYRQRHQESSPKRLVEISNNKVILRENVKQQRYVCLSHCWGVNPIITTKKSTIEAHRKCIPWDRLSATFRDAITICRSLNVSYVWIDSLCIIQDCETDWEDQAAQMAHIYANAYFTIAATKSSDGFGGCFAKTAYEYMSKPVPGYDDTYVRHALPELPIMSSEYQLGENPHWPLLNRGWIYQEMRLSPRVLHFCAQEVIWVCRTAQRSESGDNDANLISKDEWDGSFFYQTPYNILESNPKLLWYRTVTEYSRLRLSHAKDKMAALAGLAERMRNLRPGDRYLVGLWEKTLLHDLLWQLDLNSTIGTPSVARYPSWSWASSPYQVTWCDGVNKFLKNTLVEDIKVTNKGPSQLADCVEAGITLRVPLLEARSLLTSYQVHYGSQRHGPYRPYHHLYPDPFKAVIKTLDHLYVSSWRSDKEYQRPDTKSVPSALSGYLVPLAAENDISMGFAAIHIQRELSGDCYKRVGWTELAHPAAEEYYEDDETRCKYKENAAIIGKLLEDLPTHIITLI